jgi:hypothetical protein
MPPQRPRSTQLTGQATTVPAGTRIVTLRVRSWLPPRTVSPSTSTTGSGLVLVTVMVGTVASSASAMTTPAAPSRMRTSGAAPAT